MKSVTLISDFGLRDGAVAAAKGLLMQQLGTAIPITDISHDVEPRLIQQAAYLLGANYPYFSAGTCHIILVDVFYDKQPKLVLAKIDDQYFLAPDNGILSFTFYSRQPEAWWVYELKDTDNFKHWLKAVAHLAQQVINDTLNYSDFTPTNLHAPLSVCQPLISEERIECQVLHIDRYDNIVLNITKQQIESVAKGRRFTINFFGHNPIEKVSQRYTDVKMGQPLCRYNQAGYLELAINGGQAATILGFTIRKEQHIMYNVVKLEFV